MEHRIVYYGTAKKHLTQFVPLVTNTYERAKKKKNKPDVITIEDSCFKIDGILFAMMNTPETEDIVKKRNSKISKGTTKERYTPYEQTDSRLTVRGDMPILVGIHDVKLYKPLQIAWHHIETRILDHPRAYESSPSPGGKIIDDDLAKKLLEDAAKVKENQKLKDKLNDVSIKFFKEPLQEYVLELPSNAQNVPIDKDAFDKDFEAKVIQSQGINSQSRQKRLATASKMPEKVRVESTAFRRNPDVVVEVLARANGYCEECKLLAPFLRAKDHTPYLEIHHKVTLAEGGEDTVENAVALCPNCHRRMHFGYRS